MPRPLPAGALASGRVGRQGVGVDAVERAEAELYRLAPEDFVAERNAHVARAKEDGERDAAKAIGALRRPSRAAWLTNLLVHDRADEVEGLLGLADTLAAAQRSLDGSALRAISAQRNKLVGALARQAAALGRRAGHRVESTLEREVRTTLESALADPELAERVRSGRLVKAERHAGFGPAPDEDADPSPSRRIGGSGGGPSTVRNGGRGEPDAGADGGTRPRPSGRDTGDSGDVGDSDDTGPGGAGPDPATVRWERALARARAEAERAREAADRARERHDSARAESEDAERRRDEARQRVTELIEALEQARSDASAANRAAHTAATAEKETARAARTAETTRDRLEAAARDLHDG